MPTDSESGLRPLNDRELAAATAGSSERPMQHVYSFVAYAQSAFDHGVRRLESGLNIYRL
jgi:hypothetical protein